MTIIEQDFHDENKHHQLTVNQLLTQQNKLAGLENELTQRRAVLLDLQRQVERKREYVSRLQAATELSTHKCLELQTLLQDQQREALGEVAA